MQKKIGRRDFFLYSYISFGTTLIMRKFPTLDISEKDIFPKKNIDIRPKYTKKFNKIDKNITKRELIVKWILSNKEWLFSGIGVTFILGVISYFFQKKSSINQSQKSGNNSYNIQAGGNLEVNFKDNREENK